MSLMTSSFHPDKWEVVGDCWVWTGYLHRTGYGWVRVGKHMRFAHRASYEAHVGPIPDSLVLDHLCRNPPCINPAHLEPVTNAENIRRSAPATKTHCVNGHPFDEANTHIYGGGRRRCRACARSRPKSRTAEPVNPDVESYCWHEDGWECAAEGSVRDARKVTRGQAAAAFASEVAYGHLPSVRVWKRHVRPWTRQDAWEWSGAERWMDHQLDPDEGGPEVAPDKAPADWEPDWEQDPSWEFVHRSHPDAIPVWICAENGSKPPRSPALPAKSKEME